MSAVCNESWEMGDLMQSLCSGMGARENGLVAPLWAPSHGWALLIWELKHRPLTLNAVIGWRLANS